MNHPSDYMNNFEDDLSSDSSNPTIKIAHRPSSRPTRSLHHPLPPAPPPRPKHPKQPKKSKPAALDRQKQRSASDYLILGDSYLRSAKAREITRRLVEQQREETPRVMRVQRLKRKEEKSVRKIEAYIQTFAQGLRIAQAIRSLARPQKVALYQQLRAEKLQEGESMEEYFRLAVHRLEGLAGHFQQDFPSKQRLISKWKNHKLHQLSSAKSFLQQQHPSCDLQAELAILEEQRFFPELRQQAEELRESISIHLREEGKEGKEGVGKGEVDREDEGVRWVLHRLLKFILQREELVNCVLERLQEGVWPLLEDGLFIQFEREGSSSNEAEATQQRYVHILDKAIFDLVNEAAPALLPHCPYSPVDEVLGWLFEAAVHYEREELEGECLLAVADAVVEGLLEETLWEFLEFL